MEHWEQPNHPRDGPCHHCPCRPVDKVNVCVLPVGVLPGQDEGDVETDDAKNAPSRVAHPHENSVELFASHHDTQDIEEVEHGA